MSKVSITINGRQYAVGCEDGQEQHLQSLAGHLDRHITDLVDRIGQAGEVRLFLMAALMVTDEMSEALGRADTLQAEIHSLKAERDDLSERLAAMEDRAARLLHDAARKIEDVTGG